MLARINKAIAKKDSGFTLVELLVVVIIIGILAAIAIPTFLNQREAGWRAQATSNIRNGVSNAEAEAVNSNGTYTTVTDVRVNRGVPALKNAAGVDVPMTVVGASATGYCIQLVHPSFGTPAEGTFNYLKSRDTIIAGSC